MAPVTSIAPKPEPRTAFQRPELDRILSVYGRLVASGAARDYAIGMLPDRAVFAIYRRAAEQPTWRIEKVPALARRQGQYVVHGMAGQVLKRGHELESVLRVFETRRFRVVD
ncbi:MAG: DUF2794 domain-containing protein [Pseudomonadota bacterium]